MEAENDDRPQPVRRDWLLLGCDFCGCNQWFDSALLRQGTQPLCATCGCPHHTPIEVSAPTARRLEPRRPRRITDASFPDADLPDLLTDGPPTRLVARPVVVTLSGAAIRSLGVTSHHSPSFGCFFVCVRKRPSSSPPKRP